MITGNESINAIVTPISIDGNDAPIVSAGLTIRQHFAAMAMQGILTNINAAMDSKYTVNGGHLHYESIAKDAIGCADALIAELNKTI